MGPQVGIGSCSLLVENDLVLRICVWLLITRMTHQFGNIRISIVTERCRRLEEEVRDLEVFFVAFLSLKFRKPNF